jgi:hypothetical protein
VHKALLQQEIQRAIDGRRLGLRLAFAQQVEQIIGADGTLLQAHQTQYFKALWGQAHIALRTQLSACANSSFVDLSI